ncbi:MAG TPA: ABC transporter permease, partial [Pirellulales bacterium]|nr:ABC transporter permease [Pirellulales bacterium]
MKPFRIAETFVDDARYAAASMRANSGFAAAVALTLALGIGTVTAMFSVVDRLLLRAPSHISDVGQVRRIFAAVPGPDGRERIIPWFPYPAYAALRVGHTFAAVAAYAQHTTVIGRGADARPVAGASATSDFFPLLGTRPFMGRLFAPTDDDPRALAQVVILSYEFWQREFNGSPAALGKMLPVDDRAFTIIGVLPPGFTGTELGKTDFWIPMQAESTNWATSWSRGFINIVVRVTHGSAEEALARDATSRMNDAAGTGLWSYARLAVRPISSDRHGNLPAVFAVAKWLGAVALVVLLIVCANVANLLLARALDRRRETAVRLALGASTSRLMRLIATESLIITCIGGAGGLLLALVGGEAIRQRFLADIVWDAGVVDGRSLAVAATLTILAALLTSVFTMLQAGGT